MAEVMTATPAANQSGGYTWTLCNVSTKECGIGTPTSPYPTIELGAKTGSRDVVFVINDQNKTGIQFANDPFWVMPGKGQHPTGPVNNSNGQLGNPLKPSASILIVSDKNDNQNTMWLSYRLNLVNNANQAVTPIDPDWKNGGGGSGITVYYDLAFFASAATAIAVLLLLGSWIGRTMLRRKYEKSGKIG
jgi:hypothetical protein